jgi:hypothetical protein
MPKEVLWTLCTKRNFLAAFFHQPDPFFRRHLTPEDKKIPRYTAKTPTKAKNGNRKTDVRQQASEILQRVREELVEIRANI